MNKIFRLYFIIFIVAFFGCESKNDKIYIEPDLKNKISQAIDEYSEYVKEKQKDSEFSNPSIYEVSFNNYVGDCYVTINTNIHYKSNLDGFVFLKGKLLAFNNVESSCNKDLIILNEPSTMSDLEGYKSDKNSYDNYSPAYWVFKIENGNLVQDSQGKFKISFNDSQGL